MYRAGKTRLSDLPADRLRGARVLVRIDVNVPLDDGRISDDTRIRAVLPTLRLLSDAGARTVLMSHLGRPDGVDPSLSLAPVAERLSDLLHRPVQFVTGTVGSEVDARTAALDDGDLLLLENTRFLDGETRNDPEVSRALAEGATVFVQDAFGSAHRAHASTVGAAESVKAAGGVAVAGPLLDRELRYLGDALEDPDRPFVAILGGAKISGKIDLIEALLPRVDRLLVGGAMANTFWMALGLEIGGSLVEADRVEAAAELMEAAGDRLLLPVDARVATALDGSAATRVAERTDVHADEAVGDIGPATEALYREVLQSARTIVWNGPMGIFEQSEFEFGTLAVANAVAEATDRGALSILGGGDSAAAAARAGVTDRLTHVSTGGGASLSFLAGEELPGVQVLSQASSVESGDTAP